ncbi:MAG: hypothetical protein M1274_03260 [Actinobacteria bacterium]|nr:hypothetical protein [Actinomycetota bacterium]
MRRICCRLAVICAPALILLLTILALACHSGAVPGSDGRLSTSFTSTSTGEPSSTATPTGVSNSAGEVTPPGLVILLSEVVSMANYYQFGWPGYEEPLFALWPDGRVMVRNSGGYAAPAGYVQGMLTASEISEIASWLEETELGSLDSKYSLAHQSGKTTIVIFDLPTWRLRVDDGGSKTDLTFEPGYPPGEETYPAPLKKLVERLRSFRPQAGRPFVADSVEVMVEERAPLTVKGYYPLPGVYDLARMVEVRRTVESVQYKRTYEGAEAAAIAARLNAGEWLYDDGRRSYRVSYRPIVDWPEP